MNHWTDLSVQYAEQRSYLDDLFRVYPTIPEGIRDIDISVWKSVEAAFNARDNVNLLMNLLGLDLFPIKDSYVAYLRRDSSAIGRNPATVNRLCGRLYEMGLGEMFERCSEPKETNRQIGPLFRRWLEQRHLGVPVLDQGEFIRTNDNAILRGSDKELRDFAVANLGYKRDKGLDFVARFNGQYVIGEAKFLTDFGGHQLAQFQDAIETIKAEGVGAIIIAILDGVLYIRGDHKMFRHIQQHENHNIMSALVLREFLYHI